MELQNVNVNTAESTATKVMAGLFWNCQSNTCLQTSEVEFNNLTTVLLTTRLQGLAKTATCKEFIQWIDKEMQTSFER